MLIADLHGVLRGAQAPLSDMKALIKNGGAFTRSLYAMRIDGGVVEETGLGLSGGDPDYPCSFLPDTCMPVPWRKDGMQAVMTMHMPDGEPFYADPRNVLQAVLNQFAADGMTPVLAAELEFYLHREKTDSDSDNGPPPSSELYSLEPLEREGDFFALLRRAAAAQNIALENAISEYAPGQYEVNLIHQEPMRACLEAILFRRLVRCCARALGRRATFMAKPQSGIAGSGMHFHISVCDSSKKGGAKKYRLADKKTLAAATAGVLQIMNEAAIFFMPFGNSYRRFLPGQYTPMSVCWGDNNRAAAVRLPLADSPSAKRLEVRAAGADANPYLAAAAALAGMHWGMKKKLSPPPEMESIAALTPTWHAALENLSSASVLPRYIDRRFLSLYGQVKAAERGREISHIPDYHHQVYGRLI